MAVALDNEGPGQIKLLTGLPGSRYAGEEDAPEQGAGKLKIGDKKYAPSEMLFAEDIVVRRNGRAIVDVPSLAVQRGEVLAILGANGAGKSTLLKVLALLERPDFGDIYICGSRAWSGGGSGGRSGREVLSMRRRLGVVFQDPCLLTGNALYNASIGLRLRGFGGAEATGRAVKWLDTFGVKRCAHQDVRTLSGGETQRVCLARIFAMEPEILFLDEPFFALDPPSRAVLIKELCDVLRQTRITTIFVTHDLNQLPELATRVVAMREGRIVSDDSVEVFLARSSEEILSIYAGVNL
jgi:tungstate transport system ATP-binding protein